MKKTILFLIAIFIINYSSVFAQEIRYSDDALYNSFIESAKKYDASGIQVYDSPRTISKNTEKLLSKICDSLISEIKESWIMLFGLIFICVLSSLLKVFVAKTTLTDVGSYACYCVCASLVILNFKNASTICSEAIVDLSDFMDLAVPTYASVLTGCGYVGTAVSMQSMFMVISVIITHLIEKVVYPLLFCCGLLSVISGVSTTIELRRFIKLISNTVKYIIGILMTVFAGILTFSGFTSAAGDNIAVKTAKYAVSNFVPVVGGCLSDALNGIVQSSLLMKNSVGYIGFFTLISICLFPVIKSAVIIFSFRLSASAAELLAETPLSSMLDSVCDVLVTLTGMVLLVTVIFVLIIGVVASVGG